MFSQNGVHFPSPRGSQTGPELLELKRRARLGSHGSNPRKWVRNVRPSHSPEGAQGWLPHVTLGPGTQ